MIEWDKEYTEEEKAEFLRELPFELVMEARFIEMVYGQVFIVKLDNGSYELRYFDNEKHMKYYLNENNKGKTEVIPC